MSTTVEVIDSQLVEGFEDLSIHVQKGKGNCVEVVEEINKEGCYCDTSSDYITNHHGFCAVCLNKIVLQETALVKGCEHAYCVNCILRWASCKKQPTCPQCKNPFEFLNVHRALDGSIHDYMFEESVCLLLRASWFKTLVDVEREETHKIEEYYYEDEEDYLAEFYLGSSSSLRIGNRRWGDNGYVRAGRQEARPARSSVQDPGAGPSRQPKKKEKEKEKDKEKETPAKEPVGRRAKRALKREAADKAAAVKHQQHLLRLGRN